MVYDSATFGPVVGANVVEAKINGGTQVATTVTDGSGSFSVAAPGSTGSYILFLTSGGVVANTVFNYTGGSVLGAKAFEIRMGLWSDVLLYLVALLTVASTAAYLTQWMRHMESRGS